MAPDQKDDDYLGEIAEAVGLAPEEIDDFHSEDGSGGNDADEHPPPDDEA